MPINASSGAIEQYRQAKNDYLRLRNQAKKELIARFQQVANELFQIQRELLEDFGEKVAMPSKAKKTRSPKGSKQEAPKSKAHGEPAAPPSAQLISLQKQLERTKKKLSDTQSAGKPTKTVEDRIYELEDAIRLEAAK